VQPISPKEDDIRFMCIDVDHYAARPPKYMTQLDEYKETSICRLYGVNESGNSIAVHVFNFRPYFYIQVPVTMHLEQEHMDELRNCLNTKIGHPAITECELVMRQSIMHYTERASKFVKVYT